MKSNIDTERGVPPPPAAPIKKPEVQRPVALKSIRETLHGMESISEETRKAQELARRRAEAERHLLQRSCEIENAINEAGKTADPSTLIERLQKAAPNLDDTDRLIIALHHNTLEKAPSLKQKLLTGGEDIVNNEGVTARLFELETIGQGGLGIVKNSYLFVGYQLINVASKRPIEEPIPDQSDPKHDTIIENNHHARDTYLNEMEYAEKTKQLELPHIVRTVFISKATNTQPPMVIYEKITNQYGQTEGLKDLIKDPKIPPSQVITAISYAGDGLHAAHQAGLIHYDFKPENIMIDAQGRGKNTDLGSMHSVHDTLVFHTNSHGTLTYKESTKNGKRHLHYIATTEKYYDDTIAQKLQQEGRPASIIDRIAYAKCLTEILIDKELLKINVNMADVFAHAAIKKDLQLSDTDFPPASAKRLWNIIQELQDTKRTPFRPLDEINREIREIAVAMQTEIDPLFKKMIALHKQFEYNNQQVKQAYGHK